MNIGRFRSDIAAIDWSSLYATSDINLAYHIFKSKFRAILDSEAPLISRQIKNKNKKWVKKNNCGRNEVERLC